MIRIRRETRRWARPVTRGFKVALLALASVNASAQAPEEHGADVSHGLFSDVRVVRPTEPARQFVLLLTNDVETSPIERQMQRTMVAAGAMVAVVPFAPFYRRLEMQDGKCTYAPGAFENLTRHLQALEHLPTYLLPMIVGADDASSYVYATLAQAPAGTFASGLSVGFCPRIDLQTPPCAIHALNWEATGPAGAVTLKPPGDALAQPWIALQGADEHVCTANAASAFVHGVPGAEWVARPPRHAHASQDATEIARFEAAYRKLALTRVALAAPPSQLSDLPIVELPVSAGGKRFAVLLSGDGGWAGIDKSLGAALAAQGVPVAGFDSLRYFWSARTPDELAADLDRVIRYYAARWGRSEVILVGYSQGADVLPFAINRLPASTRASVRLAALLGPGQKASFEFHLGNWLGPSGDLPIAPEALKLSATDTLCIYGAAERGSLCPELAPDHARSVALTGGHHFDGEYGALAARILAAAPP